MSASEARLGFHASISGGVDRAPERVRELECAVGQIFTSSNRRWAIRDLKEGEARAFRENSDRLSGGMVAHACYLINLAKDEPEAWEKSLATLEKELVRIEELGVYRLVLHPGSHVGSGEENGLARIVDALNRVLDRTRGSGTKVLLETMAGQGTSLGYRLDQLASMREGVEQQDRIEYCLDTCHMHAAGYDLGSEANYESVMQEVEAVLGIDRVTVLHLNDSKKACDSRVDRHEHIGEGTVGEAAFRCFMNDSRWEDVPKILETPVDDDWTTDYGRNLERLVSFID